MAVRGAQNALVWWCVASCSCSALGMQLAPKADNIFGQGGDPRFSSRCQAARAGDLMNVDSEPFESVEDVVARKVGRQRDYGYWYLVNRATKTIYYKIPKSASSTVDSILHKNGYEPVLIGKADLFQQGSEFNDYCAFRFVRSPFERAVSAYYTANHLHFEGPKVGPGAHPESFVRRNDTCFSYLGAASEPARFDAFLSDLHESLVTDCSQDPACAPNYEGHALSQFDYLNSLPRNLSFVGRVENLEEDWEKLRTVCNVPEYVMAKARNRWDDHCFMCHPQLRLKPRLNKTWQPKLDWCSKPACAAAEDPAVAKKLLAYYWKDLACLGFGLPALPAGVAEWASGKLGIENVVEYLGRSEA